MKLKKVIKSPKFMWGNDVLDRADSYSYLGIMFNYRIEDNRIE